MAFISAPRGGFLGSLASLEEASDCARQSSWASFVFVFVSLPGWVGVFARAPGESGTDRKQSGPAVAGNLFGASAFFAYL